jgi:hypothetical protein
MNIKKFYLDRETEQIARGVQYFEYLCAIYDKIKVPIMAHIRETIGQPAYVYMYECAVKVAEDGTVSIPARIWSLPESKEYRLTFTLSSDYKKIVKVS